jgi:hypothetical protein
MVFWRREGEGQARVGTKKLNPIIESPIFCTSHRAFDSSTQGLSYIYIVQIVNIRHDDNLIL